MLKLVQNLNALKEKTFTIYFLISMKKIFYFLFIFISLSCSDETIQQNITDSTYSDDTKRYKSSQDDSSGPYKTLGFGVNATEPYLEYSYAQLQVIDVEKLVTERPYEYYTG